MNKMLTAMKNKSNYTYTENGALTHITTNSKVLDMFARGGAMRKASKEDKILLFKEAFEEDMTLALKCLFYLRDVREGQGERQFFKDCLHWLAMTYPSTLRRILRYVPEFGRWDDLYCFVGTPLEKDTFAFMKRQLNLDIKSKTPSLLAKWLKSENASSKETKKLAYLTMEAFGLTPKQYRIILSALRERIKVVETLISANRWDEIEFDKIPSKAGLKYKNAFARRDMIKQKYEAFIKNDKTKVNAKTLYPYEVVQQANNCAYHSMDSTTRMAVNKYWDNLTDYFSKCSFDALPVIDTSSSMRGTPLDVACSLGLYMAERNKGPFHNHYISFSRNARLIETSGVDFVDKVRRIYSANLCENTNIESVFDLILDMLIKKEISYSDLPKNIIIISDMEFDTARRTATWGYSSSPVEKPETLMEKIAHKWRMWGYEMPHLIYWNVDSRQANIPMLGVNKISYISGFSPFIFETLMHGKSGYELMLDKLMSERYNCIYVEDMYE